MTSDKIDARHAFTTRMGGVSRGIFESLNLSSSRGDDQAAVAENYRRLKAATGIDTAHMVFTNQVHGNCVRTVTAEDATGLFDPVPCEADGLVTDERGLAIICFTADCVPVLLCDGEKGVIGAVHCGWRGSVADILGNALEKMCALGARRERICAAIGPSIGRCCFEVGEEVVQSARTLLQGEDAHLWAPETGRPGKFMLDLKGVNRRRLMQLGVAEEHIDVSEECTSCSWQKYWSHRKTDGQRGTQAALVMLE